MPRTETRPATRPCPILRPTMYSTSGPGVMFSKRPAPMKTRRDWRSGTQVQMQKLVEGTLHVLRERIAVRETVLPTQFNGRVERRGGAGFQRKAFVIAAAGFGDDVTENRRSHAASKMRIGGAHRFDFAGSWPELLQRTEAKELVLVPQGVEADLRLLQSRPIEREHVTRWRVGVHAFEMLDEQCLHPGVVKVGRLDHGHTAPCAD